MNSKRNVPVRVVHLVEFVDQADALVGQDECTTFETPLAGDGVLADAGRQTDRTGTLSSCKDRAVRSLFDVLEHLRLGGTGVSEKEDVDVATNAVLAVDVLGHSSEKGEGNGRLDVVVTVDRRRHGFDDPLADPLISRELPDRVLVLFRQAERGKQVLLLVDVVRLEHGRKDGEAVLDVERSVKVVAVDAGDFDFVSRFSGVDQVPEEDDFPMARQATGRNRAGRLLQRELLVIPVDSLHVWMGVSPCKYQRTSHTDSTRLACSELTVKGPLPLQALQKLIRISLAASWKKGPSTSPHLPQSNLTYLSCGKTPERRVTTPLTRTRASRCD